MVCEQPRGVLTILGLVIAAGAIYALGYIYFRTIEQSEQQTAAYLEVGKLIERMDARLQTMDAHLRQLDIWHKQEFMQEK